MERKAIIGGTGVYGMNTDGYSMIVETEYGNVEVDMVSYCGEEIVFLPRHGKGHSIPPHLINYRANMKALEKLKVKYIYATAAVGSCNENFEPGDIVVIKDFIDFTKQRPLTFYEGGENPVKHVDMSEPYCRNLGMKFCEIAEEEGVLIKGEAVYVTTEGPRFETAAEIRMYKMLGADVVGMTSVPEVVLAKELSMCYASVGIITNWCTGMGFTSHNIKNIKDIVDENKEKITRIFLKVFKEPLTQDNCKCKDAVVRI